jgi:hypothetical protein
MQTDHLISLTEMSYGRIKSVPALEWGIWYPNLETKKKLNIYTDTSPFSNRNRFIQSYLCLHFLPSLSAGQIQSMDLLG